MLRFTILASSSSGNCAYLETDDTRILVDAGLSCRQIETRLAAMGRRIEDLDAIFLTHEHSDHTRGIPQLMKKHCLPVFCNRLTAQCLSPAVPECPNFHIFETGSTLSHGDLMVESFSVPHDAYDPVGFVFTHALGKIGFLTDLGCATRLVLERVRASRALVLETNYDLGLLQADTRRPWSVKQRILSRHGHLSNSAAGEALAQIVHDGMEDVYLGHLSSDCNEPDLALATVAQRVTEFGQRVPRLHKTSPDVACATLAWD